MKQQVALLGTGIMGGHMARNLAKAKYQVTVWNRSLAKAKKLASSSIRVATTPASAVADAKHVILMLSDGPVCDAVLEDGVYSALKPNSSIIVMSSTDLDSTNKQHKKSKKLKLRYLDAPVSGGEKGAKEANLSIMVGGSKQDFKTVKPILSALGIPILIGPVGSGQLTKFANQLVVASTLCAVAEGFILAKKGGADLKAVRKALLGGFANSTVLTQHGVRMIERNFVPGGPSQHQLKDLVNIVDAAKRLNLDLKQLKLVKKMYAEFVKEGGGDLDHSAIYKHIERKSKT